jgi:hypothetical protein
VQTSHEFVQGTILDLSFESAGVTEQAILLKVEVRWCKKDPHQPDVGERYTLGLRVVEETEGPWSDLLPKLLDQFDEFKGLFSSLPG